MYEERLIDRDALFTVIPLAKASLFSVRPVDVAFLPIAPAQQHMRR